MFDIKGLYYQNDGAGGGTAAAPVSEKADSNANETLTWEIWYSEQDDTIKGLLEGHTKGLKSALDSERENRKTFEKQIKDLAAKAEKGSEAERQLNALSEQIESTDRKAAFYEDAHAAGITNLKLAFLVASTEQLFDKKGKADFVTMRSQFPELFAKPVIKGNAGDGSETLSGGQSMNDAIRRMAGKK